MSLPGKLSIGLLAEDNPLKSYFCYKPLLVEENGAFVPFDDPASYPENGCIRIVPDKNESSHFKIRMRRIGAYAMVDLRAHAGENDKIRSNKNYRGDGFEPNAYIIYSDVIAETAPGLVFSLLEGKAEEAENSVLEQLPRCPDVLLYDGEHCDGQVWRCVRDEADRSVTRLVRTELSVHPESLRVFDLQDMEGSPLRLAVDLSRIPAAPAREFPRPAPRREEIPVPEAKPSAPAEPVEEAPSPAPAPAPAEPAPAAAAPETPEREKPWLNREKAEVPQESRRGRGLKEIIDEKWRHSRIDQLGMPTPEVATGAPLQSPSQRAIDEVKRAWELPEAREALLDAIAQLDGAEDALAARREALRQSAVNDQLTELEAQRLEMLSDLDKLRTRQVDIRDELKEEIRRDEAASFADQVRRTERAKAAREKAEAEAQAAEAAARGVEDALSAMEDGRFEERLSAFVVNSRAAALIRHEAPAPVEPPVEGEDAEAAEIVKRVRTRFIEEGITISQTDAVNLLIALTQRPLTLISGAPGTGKTAYLKLLAEALGLERGRFLLLPPDEGSLAGRKDIEALRRGGAPGLIALDDLNLCSRRAPLRGLNADRADSLWLAGTVQDEGHPLPGWLLSRAALIRLNEERPETPWAPRDHQPARTQPAISTEALLRAFGPQSVGMPGHVLERMDKLRRDLALAGIRLTRGTLNAVWYACTAGIPLMPLEATSILDLNLSQILLPLVLATAPVKSLKALSGALNGLPRCQAMLEQPLPIKVC